MSRTLKQIAKGAGNARKAAAIAKRDKLKAIAEQVAAMSESQRKQMTGAGIMTIEGRALSTHNMCLIVSQIPNATIVGGFKQWITAGRVVRKGEHGASIWVPGGSKTLDDGTVKPWFIAGTVFDVSQTDVLIPAAVESKPKAETIAKRPAGLLYTISQMGGISTAGGTMRDITGETRTGAGVRGIPPGLFRETGRGLDDLATQLADLGYAIPDMDVDGGVQGLRDMIRDEVDGRARHVSGFGEVAEFEHRAAA